MNFKIVGGSLSALLLAAALAGCNGSTVGTGTNGAAAGGDTIATVGSSTVTHAQLAQTLEGIYGEQLLPQLIDAQLLAEALKAKNMTVTDDEVTAELTRIEEQDPTVKTAVDAGGPRVEVIKNQVRRNLSVQKLLTDGIPSDEAKEKAFFATYSSYYGTPTQNKLGLLAASTKVRADQMARALQSKPDSFDALVIEQKAKATTDPIAGQSTSDVGRFETPDEFGTSRGIPPQAVAPLVKALATAKKGQVLPVQALAPAGVTTTPPTGPFLIVKIVDRKDATKPDFTALHAQVETDYKMAQVAEAEIKKNPQNPQTLQQNIKQLITYMAQPNPQTGAPGVKATLRDALTTILRAESNNMLDKLRTAGTVQISDATYKDVAKQYQPLPGAAGATGNTATDTNAAADANTAAATTNSATTNSATTNSATTNAAAATTNTATTNSAAPAKP